MAEIYNSIVPNKIKIDYTTQGFPNTFHYDSNYLNVNTWYFGIDVNRPYGPSSGTGWYQGVNAGTIDDVIYTIYYTGTTIGNTGNANDKYRCVQYTDPQGVINFVNNITNGSPTVGSLPEALNWFKDNGYTRGGNGENVCVNMDYPNIPTSELIFGVDSGFVASYPWTNSIWYDLGMSTMSGFSGNSAIITNFNDRDLFFDFSNGGLPIEYFTSSRQGSLGQDFTIIFWGSPAIVADTLTHPAFSVDLNLGSGPTYVGIYDDKGNVNFYFRVYDTSDGIKDRIGVSGYTSGAWAQFSYVFETNGGGTTTTSFYYNDILSEQNEESYLIKSWDFASSGEGWAIGQFAGGKSISQNYFGGMAVLLVYNRALSGTEIAYIYSNYQATRSLFA
jgi:hypothetical protein